MVFSPLGLWLLLPVLAQSEAGNWRDSVQFMLAEERHGAAVAILEEHLEKSPEDTEAWCALGGALETLGREAGSSPYIRGDARNAWRQAVETGPFDLDALRGCAAILLVQGDYDEAAVLAARAWGLGELRGQAKPEGLAELLVRARIGVFERADHENEERWSADLTDTWATLRGALKHEPHNPQLVLVHAGFLESLDLPDLASEVLAAALLENSANADLHRKLTDLHVRSGTIDLLVSHYAQFGEGGMNGALAWYTGYVERLMGDRSLRAQRFGEALAAYSRSMQWMDTAQLLEPGFASGSNFIRTQAHVSRTWCYLGLQDLGAAEEELRAVLSSDPDQLDSVDGLGRSARHAASSLGDALVARNRFERAAGMARTMLEVAPQAGRWWNNLGFLLREHGTQIECGTLHGATPDVQRANAVYRESWQAYQRAAELSPRDARIVNDAALVQVYHVRDELDRAEEMLRRAISTGESQLEALGAEATEFRRFPLAQAVGDAYQNIGYLYYHLYNKPEESRPYWVASMQTNSGDRSQFQTYLDAIDGDGPAVTERVPRAAYPIEADVFPESASMPWEADLAEAFEASAAGTLVLYNHGDGLGLGIPYLDRHVRSSQFAEATRGAILVVGDSLRHAFVDRTVDGRRLPCPRWGAITCAEHIAVATEFSAWMEQRSGTLPGESEEGLWLRQPGGTLEPLKASVEMFGGAGLELEVQRVDPLALGELQRLAEEADASPLVSTRRGIARSLIERLLFEAPSQVQRRIVYALKRDEHPESRALLDAAARQSRDPDLSLLVIEDWRGRDLGALRHAEAWSIDGSVRQAASAALSAADGKRTRTVSARSIFADRQP